MYLERYFLPYLTWIILLLEVTRTMKLLHFFILDIISWCWTWFSQSFWQSFLNAKTSFCFVQNKKSLLQNFLHIHIGTRISKWTIFYKLHVQTKQTNICAPIGYNFLFYVNIEKASFCTPRTHIYTPGQSYWTISWTIIIANL